MKIGVLVETTGNRERNRTTMWKNKRFGKQKIINEEGSDEMEEEKAIRFVRCFFLCQNSSAYNYWTCTKEMNTSESEKMREREMERQTKYFNKIHFSVAFGNIFVSLLMYKERINKNTEKREFVHLLRAQVALSFFTVRISLCSCKYIYIYVFIAFCISFNPIVV